MASNNQDQQGQRQQDQGQPGQQVRRDQGQGQQGDQSQQREQREQSNPGGSDQQGRTEINPSIQQDGAPRGNREQQQADRQNPKNNE